MPRKRCETMEKDKFLFIIFLLMATIGFLFVLWTMEKEKEPCQHELQAEKEACFAAQLRQLQRLDR